MNILVTGSDGFIARNLLNFFNKNNEVTLDIFNKSMNLFDLEKKINNSDFIFHLAGVNRSVNEKDFIDGNVNLTNLIKNILMRNEKKIPIYFSSSIHVNSNELYARTKQAAEQILYDLALNNHNKVWIDRLPRIYGPGARPDYNSVISTLSYRCANNMPVFISNPEKKIEVFYIGDLLSQFNSCISNLDYDFSVRNFDEIMLGDLYYIIKSFKNGVIKFDKYDPTFIGKLYKTYQSYM